MSYRSHDGRMLSVASTDGYISIVCFEENEIGVPYSKQVFTARTKGDDSDIDPAPIKTKKNKAKTDTAKAASEKDVKMEKKADVSMETDQDKGVSKDGATKNGDQEMKNTDADKIQTEEVKVSGPYVDT